MPYTERDLFAAVLAGETETIPDPLRPVADTLAALRAAPTAAELSGEAAARAAFLAVMRGTAADRTADPAPTLVLPPAAADARPRRAARHRRTASSRPALLFRPVVLLSAAAAVVLLLVVGLTTLAPGSLRSPGISASPKASGTPGSMTQGSAPSLAGTGSAAPTSAPSVPAPPPSPSPATMCRELFALFLSHPHSAYARQQEQALAEQLAQLAGGQDKMWGYCLRQMYGSNEHRPGPDGYQFGPGNPFAPSRSHNGQSGASGQAGAGGSGGGTAGQQS